MDTNLWNCFKKNMEVIELMSQNGECFIGKHDLSYEEAKQYILIASGYIE